MPNARDAIERAASAGLKLATAESVTGGGVAAALTAVPGASAAFRGGIVAYDERAKVDLLSVDGAAIRDHGVVSIEVALQMAAGACRALGADAAVATTGAAGPEPHGGARVGRVCVAAVGPAGEVAREIDVEGDRAAVCVAATSAAISALCEVLPRPRLAGTPVG